MMSFARVPLWVAFQAIVASCSSSPEAVVTRRATRELACPAGEIETTCRGGIVFHLAEQCQSEAHGCAKSAEYRCEARLRTFGRFEFHLATTCE
jgi:hypothetical protein